MSGQSDRDKVIEAAKKWHDLGETYFKTAAGGNQELLELHYACELKEAVKGLRNEDILEVAMKISVPVYIVFTKDISTNVSVKEVVLDRGDAEHLIHEYLKQKDIRESWFVIREVQGRFTSYIWVDAEEELQRAFKEGLDED